MSQNQQAFDPADVFDEHVPPKPIKIRDDQQVERVYTIIEFEDSDGLSTWISKISPRFRDGKEDYKGYHEDLIEMTLRDEKGQRVPRSKIEGWGAKIKNRLFDLAQQANGLTDKAFKIEGKGSGGGASSTGGTGSPPNSTVPSAKPGSK